MFSWKWGPSRSPAGSTSPAKTRSMPIPLQGHQDATKLKNLSGAEQTPPELETPAPEFSRARASRSVDSLRRLVGRSGSAVGADAAVSTRACAGESHDTKRGRDSSSQQTPPERSVSTPTQSPSSTWSWSWFRGTGNPPAAKGEVSTAESNNNAPPRSSPGDQSQVKNDSDGASWGFWAKKSRAGTETGDLAVSNTDTERRPRPAEARPPSSKKLKTSKLSLLLPAFEALPWQSRTDRLAKLLWSAPPRMMRSSPLRIKKAVVIGIHGYFPARVTRAILGEPTGTSLRFASEAEEIVRQWFATNMAGADYEVDQIALEGEGRINHRVDSLYALLLNWESLVRQADLIFFAVHSQGAVVALRMVARLIAEKKLNPHTQRTAILGMAGSLLGPMPEMDQTLVMKAITRIEHDSLLELFELQRPDSALSQDLKVALRDTLYAGVKLILVGSADDQLVPLYSALGVHVQHPNIFRAVYIDGDDVSPTVAAPLLNIALQQLNAGESDHGIITELSGPLAGALTSKGHSKLYGHDAVYRLGVQVALETPFMFGIFPEIDTAFRIPKATANPFVLPWATQALVTEALNNERLMPVVFDLLREYDTWRPAAKPMKDLKWRLAGLKELARSKL